MANKIQEADPRERKRARLVHLVGVVFFVLVLFAALAGLLGKGRLSKVRIGSVEAGLQVEHFRFIRYQGPVDLKVVAGADATPNGMLRLQLSKAFVEQVEIQRIEPEPEATTAGPTYFTYDIRTETNAAAEVTVRFVSNHFGRLAYEVGLAEGPTLKLRHIAFP
jgi:hypothetical protein